jgi:hypothetical protein
MEMQAMTNEFSVYWTDPDGNNHKELAFVSARDAVEKAHSLSTRPAAKIGVIQKIIITDASDFTCFLWQDGKVVYPNQDTLPVGSARHDN